MERILSRALIAMATALAAIILVATAAIFLGAALYLYLVSLAAPPAVGALVVGLTGLALAGLVLLAFRMAAGCGRTPRRDGDKGSADPGLADTLDDLAARLGSRAARQLTDRAHAHPYRSFTVALVAGLAIGGSPELRAMLDKMLKN